MNLYYNSKPVIYFLLLTFLFACSDAADNANVEDTFPPEVKTTQPTTNQIDVDVQTTLSIEFNEAINADSIEAERVVTLARISVVNGAEVLTDVPGTVTYFENNKTAVFTVDNPQDVVAASDYVATVNPVVTDIKGNTLTQAYQWRFQTTKLPTVLSVTSVIDSNAVAGEFPREGGILVTFSEPMNIATLDVNNINLKDWSGNDVPGAIVLDDASHARFLPDSRLLSEAPYTLQIIGGQQGIQDANFNTMTSDYNFELHTAIGWIGAEQISNEIVPALKPNLQKTYTDNNGNIYIFWTQSEPNPAGAGNVMRLFGKRFDVDLQSWSDKFTFNSDTATTVLKFTFSIDNENNGILLWTQNDPDNTNIYTRYYDFQRNSWGDLNLNAEKLNTNTEQFGVQNYFLEFDGNGNALVVWLQNDNATPTGMVTSLFARYFDYIEGWGDLTVQPDLLENDNTSQQSVFDPKITVDGNDNFVVTWVQGNLKNFFVRTFTNVNQSWGNLTGEPDKLGEYVSSYKIFPNTNGDFLLLFTQSDQDNIGDVGVRSLFARWYDVSQGFGDLVTGLKKLELDNGFSETGDPHAVNTYSAIYDLQGNAHIVWSQDEADNIGTGIATSLFARFYNVASNNWGNLAGPPIRLETLTSAQHNVTRFSLTRSSWPMVVWTQKEPDDTGGVVESLFYRVYKTNWGGVLPGRFELDNAPGHDVSNLYSISQDVNEKILVAWEQMEDDSGGGLVKSVFARHYHINNIGELIQLETDNNPGNDATRPIIEQNPFGNAVVKWTQSQNNSQVFNMRFFDNINGWSVNTKSLNVDFKSIIDRNGNVVMLWRDIPQGSTIPDLFSQRFQAQTNIGWGKIESIKNTLLHGNIQDVSLYSDNNDNISVIYKHDGHFWNNYLPN